MHSRPSPSPTGGARVQTRPALVAAQHAHDDSAAPGAHDHRHIPALPRPSQTQTMRPTRTTTRQIAAACGRCSKLRRGQSRRRVEHGARTLGFLLAAAFVVDDVCAPGDALAGAPLGAAELEYADCCVGFSRG